MEVTPRKKHQGKREEGERVVISLGGADIFKYVIDFIHLNVFKICFTPSDIHKFLHHVQLPLIIFC